MKGYLQVSIRPAKMEDLPYIKRMCDRYIGMDYYTSEYLRRAYGEPDHYFTVYTDESDIPVAFLYMFITSFSEAGSILRSSVRLPVREAVPGDQRVGIFKTTCTEEPYRGKGILSELMSYCEDIFRDIGVGIIFLNALKLPSGKIPSVNGLYKHKFMKLTDISHPWSDIASYCPYCKKQHCVCDAVLYYKEID